MRKCPIHAAASWIDNPHTYSTVFDIARSFIGAVLNESSPHRGVTLICSFEKPPQTETQVHLECMGSRGNPRIRLEGSVNFLPIDLKWRRPEEAAGLFKSGNRPI